MSGPDHIMEFFIIGFFACAAIVGLIYYLFRNKGY